jgi:hypothetical protein
MARIRRGCTGGGHVARAVVAVACMHVFLDDHMGVGTANPRDLCMSVGAGTDSSLFWGTGRASKVKADDKHPRKIRDVHVGGFPSRDTDR